MNVLCLLNNDLNLLNSSKFLHSMNVTVDVSEEAKEKLKKVSIPGGDIPGNISSVYPHEKIDSLEDIAFYIDGVDNITVTNTRFVKIKIHIYYPYIEKLRGQWKKYFKCVKGNEGFIFKLTFNFTHSVVDRLESCTISLAEQ